jgi:hypothetical protein
MFLFAGFSPETAYRQIFLQLRRKSGEADMLGWKDALGDLHGFM